MTKANGTKREILTAYVNEVEKKMTEELVNHTGLSTSKLIITLLRQEHFRVFGRKSIALAGGGEK